MPDYEMERYVKVGSYVDASRDGDEWLVVDAFGVVYRMDDKKFNRMYEKPDEDECFDLGEVFK